MSVNAQPGINSIYSAYGIGDVSIRENNSYFSMGGVGIAITSDKMLNGANPASYAAIPYGSYSMELSVGAKNIQYTNPTQSFSTNDLEINGATLGFNISKRMGGAIALKRYSTVEYSIETSKYLQGTNTSLTENITGTGGLYLATAAVGYNLTKNLSVGVSGGSIFGTIATTENIFITPSSGFSTVTSSFYNKLYTNAGFQLKVKAAGINWILGSVIQPSIQLNRYDDFSITDLSGNPLYQDSTTLNKFKYPLQWGSGITAQKSHSTISFDYIQQNWGATNYFGNSFYTKNLQNFAIGYKHSTTRKLFNRYVEGRSFMLGVQHELSYIVINGYQVQSTSATAGVNFPSKNGRYNYTLGFKYGQRGEIATPLVKESFLELNLNISLANFINVGGAKYF